LGAMALFTGRVVYPDPPASLYEFMGYHAYDHESQLSSRPVTTIK
jgi:hypothetical protein